MNLLQWVKENPFWAFLILLLLDVRAGMAFVVVFLIYTLYEGHG